MPYPLLRIYGQLKSAQEGDALFLAEWLLLSRPMLDPHTHAHTGSINSVQWVTQTKEGLKLGGSCIVGVWGKLKGRRRGFN